MRRQYDYSLLHCCCKYFTMATRCEYNNYTLKQQLSPALKCFLLEFISNELVMNIN